MSLIQIILLVVCYGLSITWIKFVFLRASYAKDRYSVGGLIFFTIIACFGILALTAIVLGRVIAGPQRISDGKQMAFCFVASIVATICLDFLRRRAPKNQSK